MSIVSQYWWIPVSIVMSIASAYMSYYNSVDKTVYFFVMTWILSAIPMWPIVSKLSNNIVYDSILYDTLLIIVYTTTMCLLGGSTLSIKQLICIAVIVIALIIFNH